jgi:hypothetical protein
MTHQVVISILFTEQAYKFKERGGIVDDPAAENVEQLFEIL